MNPRLDHRSSGVQLHPTSLASGRLGDDAYRFVDWLAEAGQSWWQMLPLGPPDRAGSPYKSKSAFAAWRGLLADPAAPVGDDEIEAFRARESFWIDDWAAVAGGRRAIADQVRFDREWSALRAYAAERGVRLIGDVPIYVAPGGADHRAWPQLFRSGDVAGAPPDTYSDLGQLWGNPLYDWPALAAPRLPLVDRAPAPDVRALRRHADRPLPRLRRLLGRARGRAGRTRRALAARAGARGLRRRGGASSATLPVIAEDLGVITEPVERLRRALGFPGMVVLQFGFDPGDPHGPHRLENHEAGSVVYTGTHDQDTLAGWWASLRRAVARRGARADRRRRLREDEIVVVAHPARVLLAGAAGDGPGPGRARARQRGAHEHPRARDGLVALADG